MTSTHRLVCCAIPFGYGPPAKLLTIAHLLARRGIHLDFVGRGIAHELVARHGSPFASIHCCRPSDRRAWDVVRSSSGMLAMMDREFAPLAIRAGKPLYVVDSLLWMRPTIPSEFDQAAVYWAQRFVPSDSRRDEHTPCLTSVGPIVSGMPILERDPGDEVILNLGGCESSDDRQLEQSYAEFIVRGLIRSRSAFGNSCIVTSGRRCSAMLRAQFAGCGVEFLSLPHDKALERFRRSAMVLTSPGLTATLECFQRRIPTYFLPPQNYSQWCILRHLRHAGLAPHSMHWEDMRPDRLGERLPPSLRNPFVRRAILAGVGSARASDLFHHCLTGLADFPESDRAGLAARQRQFFDSLGPNGAETVAGELSEAIGWTRSEQSHLAAVESRQSDRQPIDTGRSLHGTS